MRISNVGIGLFVVGGLVLFGVGMFLIGDRHQAFTRHHEYYSEFVNLAGLANGAKVRVAGMDVLPERLRGIGRGNRNLHPCTQVNCLAAS